MRKIYQAIIIGFVFFCLLSENVSAKVIAEGNESIERKASDDITEINNLIEDSKILDGKEVIIQGEAIGECMVRGDYAWVNINDGTNAIGVWLKRSEAKKVNTYGNYKNIGDIIQVTGVFSRACSEHGGEADLHARSISIVKAGYLVERQVPHLKIVVAIVLCIIPLILVLVRYKEKRKFLNQDAQKS